MKNYFDLKLSGMKLFQYFIWIYVATIGCLIYSYDFISKYELVMNGMVAEEVLVGAATTTIISFVVAIFVSLVVLFFIVKVFVESIKFKGLEVEFTGSFAKYFRITLIGFLLTILTVGIYGAWFSRSLVNYFTKHISYNKKKFSFHGVAIVLLGLFLMGVIFGLIYNSIAPLIAKDGTFLFFFIRLILPMISWSFGVVSTLWWLINFKGENTKITFSASGCVKLFLLTFITSLLSTVTLGIAFPICVIVIYRDSLKNVVMVNEESGEGMVLATDANVSRDYLYLLGQFLLVVVTLGILTPWALANSANRLVSKSYVV